MLAPAPGRIYLAKGATDLRKSINTLAALVQASFEMDPYDKNMYVFCNRSRNRLKILQYDPHSAPLSDHFRRNYYRFAVRIGEHRRIQP